jgi:FkbM family methyltransferase
MSIRNSVRRGLVSLDSRLGIREWLRQDNSADDARALTQPSDPFALSELRHPRPNTVLDIGANNGQFAEDVFRAFPGVTVYAFEPITECYERLLLMREQQPTLRPIQLALSDRDGEMDFWLSRFRDSSSIQEMMPAHTEAWPHTGIEAKIRVPIARLDSIAAGLDLKPPVFAKLDVQGHELAVINGGRETLSRCQRVMLECNFAPLYKGQPSFTQLYDELHSLGFLFDGFISALRHPQTFEQLSSDALFYKPPETHASEGEVK